MKNLRVFSLAALFVFLFGVFIDGCKKESNPATPPEEVEHPPATAVTFAITDNATGAVDTCMVRDTTLVPGGVALIGSLNLTAGHSYHGTFRLYDESANPVKVVTEDIISEADAHIFLETPSDTNRVKISNSDKDSKGLLFGMNFTITVISGAAATGTIHVVLQHHDDGIKFNSDGTYHEPYDFDLDADYPYTIQ